MGQDMILDDGLKFGIGVFETLYIYKQKPVFLREHLERMNEAVVKLGMKREAVSEKEILYYAGQITEAEAALRITVTEQNCIWETRRIPYGQKQREQGLKLCLAHTRRNESSLFTYLKSLNSGDNYIERASAKNRGFDEALFLNSSACICEGSMSNIYFSDGMQIVTPSVGSGLLDGIIRKCLVSGLPIQEKEIHYADMKQYKGAFLSNSLMGVLPISQIEGVVFDEREAFHAAEQVLKEAVWKDRQQLF